MAQLAVTVVGMPFHVTVVVAVVMPAAAVIVLVPVVMAVVMSAATAVVVMVVIMVMVMPAAAAVVVMVVPVVMAVTVGGGAVLPPVLLVALHVCLLLSSYRSGRTAAACPAWPLRLALRVDMPHYRGPGFKPLANFGVSGLFPMNSSLLWPAPGQSAASGRNRPRQTASMSSKPASPFPPHTASKRKNPLVSDKTNGQNIK